MKYCALTFVVGLFFVAGLAFGADIDGKWAGEIDGMDGNKMQISYTFKAEGATLTGTTAAPGPEGGQKAIPIKDGKIDGNNISFSITVDFGGQEMKMDYKGVLSGDTLKLTMDMMGQPMDFMLKRAK